MIQERPLTIRFSYKDQVETRKIYWMHISFYQDVKEFYRIPGKKVNFDVYKVDGVWVNKIEPGLNHDLLQLVGEAIERAENKVKQ